VLGSGGMSFFISAPNADRSNFTSEMTPNESHLPTGGGSSLDAGKLFRVEAALQQSRSKVLDLLDNMRDLASARRHKPRYGTVGRDMEEQERQRIIW